MQTAAIARQFGGGSQTELPVTVLERTNLQERGKGYVLEWAFSQLLARTDAADVYCIVDADTWVAPDFLQKIAAAVARTTDTRGFAALQGRYGVLNQQEGWRAALMTGAFDLVNHVKLLGGDYLRLNVGLKGNGMAFTRATLQKARWRGHSITEDIDYGLDLILHHNLRIRYVPDAVVQAQMPTTAAQGAPQRARWEKGRYRLLRERAPSLLGAGLIRLSPRLIDAGVGLIVPPLAEIAIVLFVWGMMIVVGALLQLIAAPLWWFFAWGITVLGFVGYILGGFQVAGTPTVAYRALLQAPFYALWKIVLYVTRFRSGKKSAKMSDEWVRTERAPLIAHEEVVPRASSGSVPLSTEAGTEAKEESA